MKYLDDPQKLLKQLQKTYSGRTGLMNASIKTALDSNTSFYIDNINALQDILDGKGEIGLNEESKKILQSFGTAKNLRTIVEDYKEFGDNSNYFDLAGYDQADGIYTKKQGEASWGNTGHTFERTLMDVFGIKTDGVTVEAAQESLRSEMKKSFNAAGINVSGYNYHDYINYWKEAVQTDNMGIWSDFLDAQSNYYSLKTQKNTLIDEGWQQEIDNYLKKLDDGLQSGSVSWVEYTEGLKNFNKSGKATAKQINEVNEKLEDSNIDKLSEWFNDGAISASELTKEL